MPATLTVPVSDAVLARLHQRAAQQGVTPEAVAAADLEQAADAPVAGERLRRWAGAFDSGLPDLASRHHDHLGHGLHADLQGGAADDPVR